MSKTNRFSNKEESLAWLLSSRWQDSKPGLSRTMKLASYFDHPEDQLTFIHIAGTNGKGSTAMLLQEIFYLGGKKVGFYTSPEINSFNERIQVNKKPISDQDLLAIMNEIYEASQCMDDKPSQFEMLTVLALVYFKKYHCDMVILETGMGGALDSTNIIPAPYLSLFVPIAMDHTQYLGSSIGEIAEEKAGILKKGTKAAISCSQGDEAKGALEARAQDLSIPYYMVDTNKIDLGSSSIEGQIFSYQTSQGTYYKDLHLKMLGSYQVLNACTVLEAFDFIGHDFSIPRKTLYQAFAQAHHDARFEILQKNPLWIADAAHNPQGAQLLKNSINKYFPKQKVQLLFGVLADKDYKKIIEELDPIVETYHIFTPENHRALPKEELEKQIHKLAPEKNIYSYPSLASALDYLNKEGKTRENQIYLASGSLSFMGELRAYFL